MKRVLLIGTALLGLMGSALASTVTLTWTNPTTRTDSSTITGALTTQIWDLATVAGIPNVNTQIGTGTSPFKTGQLVAGTHAFTVVECEANGACSAPSNVVTLTIVPVAPNAVTNLTGTVGP